MPISILNSKSDITAFEGGIVDAKFAKDSTIIYTWRCNGEISKRLQSYQKWEQEQQYEYGGSKNLDFDIDDIN